jgi:hypothetical protein
VVAGALLIGSVGSLILELEAHAAPRAVVLSPGKGGADVLLEAMEAAPGPELPKADAKRFQKVMRAAERGDPQGLTDAWDAFAAAYFVEETQPYARTFELMVLAKAAQRHAPDLARRAKLAADTKRRRDRIVRTLASLTSAQAQAKRTGRPVVVKLGDTASEGETMTAEQIRRQIVAFNDELEQVNHSFNIQYVGLQQEMQAENRRYTVLSNIMKTRHDTAKNAISNVR